MSPLVTVAVPSFNQGRFLDDALQSIFEQDIDIEVFVLDGGSTDNSLAVIKKWETKLAGWRSGPDNGQAAAINEGIRNGKAPFVCWLNSDDLFYKNGLKKLLERLTASPESPAVYGNCWHIDINGCKKVPYITLPFSRYLLANYCFVAQPATLIRRSCWEAVGGLDESKHMAMDYDMWWKLAEQYGKFSFTFSFCAANRMHENTKTHTQTDLHYKESIDIVRRYYGRVPSKWFLMKPVTKMLRKIVSTTR